MCLGDVFNRNKDKSVKTPAIDPSKPVEEIDPNPGRQSSNRTSSGPGSKTSKRTGARKGQK